MPLRTHERPNLPYNAKPKRNNDRYQRLTSRDKPPTAEMLDADNDYIIDSLDVLSQDIQNVQAGAIVGSNLPQNRNKLLTTDGNSIGWTYVRSSNIDDGAITNPKLATNAVTEGKLQNSSVTNPKLADLCITQRNIRDASVGTNQIINKNVTRGKIADYAVGAGQLDNLAITTPKLANEAVTDPKIGAEAVNTRHYKRKSITYDKLADNVIFASIFPVGVVLPYAASNGNTSSPYSAPPGWLLCNGASILRAGYPSLYQVINVIYGSVSDEYFNLPDLRGRFIAGYIGGSTAGRITTRSTQNGTNGLYTGGTGGSEIHQLTEAEMPKHKHGYEEGIRYHASRYKAGPDIPGHYNNIAKYTTERGGSSPHNNMPPFILMSYIIKY